MHSPKRVKIGMGQQTYDSLGKRWTFRLLVDGDVIFGASPFLTRVDAVNAAEEYIATRVRTGEWPK